MGRPPSNGGPSFRFNPAEVAEMEAILQAHKVAMPAREVLVSLADKFSSSPERSGKVTVQMKQVWNWFQNRRYALRAKASKSPVKPGVSSMPGDNSPMLRNVPQAPQSVAATSATFRPLPQVPQQAPASSVQSANRNASDTVQMEYEAKSARDGAWYDVSTFLSHRSLEAGDPEVLVRFAGFGPEEDEWVVVRKNVRQRSLPCESSECVAVLPGDLILCFQEGKEQALYFDAHVLDAQRRRHDVRGCRCRFLVRYDHDQSEEIVALRKICRRPETDYRLQQLHAVNETANVNQTRTGANIHTGSTLRVYPPAEAPQRQHRVEPVAPSAAEVPQKQHKVEPVTPSHVQVQQKQLKVEPAAPAPPVDVTPEKQYKIEPLPPTIVAPQTQHKVETAVLTPPIETPQEQPNMQPLVPGPPAEILKTHKTELSVPAPPTEASQAPHKVEPLVPTASEEVPQVHCKEESLVTSPSRANAPDGAEIQLLQQSVVPSPPNAPEVECQLPKVADIVSTSSIGDSNAPPENASAITNDDAVVTAVKNTNVPQEEDSMMPDCATDPIIGDTDVASEDAAAAAAAAAVTTNNATDTVVEIADVILEDVAATSDNAVDTVVGNSAEPLEDATVTNNNAVGTTVGKADVSVENAGVTSNDATNAAAGSADVSLEDGGVTSDDAVNTAAANADVSLEDAAAMIENPTSTISGDDAQNMERG